MDTCTSCGNDLWRGGTRVTVCRCCHSEQHSCTCCGLVVRDCGCEDYADDFMPTRESQEQDEEGVLDEALKLLENEG